MLPPLVQWQKYDDGGIVYPWFTHPFLEVLDKWDLKNKSILEWGGGYSTFWWVSRGAHVVCVETNSEWASLIQAEINEKELGIEIGLHCIQAKEGESDDAIRKAYLSAFESILSTAGPGADFFGPDIVVVDGVLRYECMQKGIELLKRNRGGKLIVDNFQQDGFICPACVDLVAPYEGHIYRQENHTDHHGNPWQTAYWEIK